MVNKKPRGGSRKGERRGGKKPTPGGCGAIYLRGPNTLFEKIDEFSDQMGDNPGRPETVRRIIEAFIDQGFKFEAA